MVWAGYARPPLALQAAAHGRAAAGHGRRARACRALLRSRPGLLLSSTASGVACPNPLASSQRTSLEDFGRVLFGPPSAKCLSPSRLSPARLFTGRGRRPPQCAVQGSARPRRPATAFGSIDDQCLQLGIALHVLAGALVSRDRASVNPGAAETAHVCRLSYRGGVALACTPAALERCGAQDQGHRPSDGPGRLAPGGEAIYAPPCIFSW